MVRKDHKPPSGKKRGTRKCPRFKKCKQFYNYKNNIDHYNDLGFCSWECREKYILANASFS